MPVANIRKVSMITLRVKNRSDLKARVDIKPKRAPIKIEIRPTITNCSVSSQSVSSENSFP